jgi:hypothetical protein
MVFNSDTISLRSTKWYRKDKVFDKITVENPTEYIETEKTVTINRASTDKSVELLNEFQDKAAKNIIERIVVEDNKFDYVIVTGVCSETLQKYYQFKFTLNGEVYYGKDFFNNYDSYHINDFLKEIKKKLVEAIYSALFKKLVLEDIPKNAYRLGALPE